MKHPKHVLDKQITEGHKHPKNGTAIPTTTGIAVYHCHKRFGTQQ
jgi:hypothetical protein